MTVFEGLSFDDAALHLCPGVTVGIFKAGIKVAFCIWTGTAHFPAVSKLQDITDKQLVLSGKVILAVPIEVATQTTHLTLCGVIMDQSPSTSCQYTWIGIAMLLFIKCCLVSICCRPGHCRCISLTYISLCV